MAEFTWTISTTEYSLKPDGMPDRITTAHWRCAATQGGTTAGAYGSSVMDLDASTATEADVLAEVQAENPDVESSLQAQLDAIGAPQSGSGLPWVDQHPAWMVDTAYAVDDHANFEGTVYVCIQAHTSQAGWTPPVTPAMWQVKQDPVPGDKVWVAGEAVEVDDIRFYPTLDDAEYRCIQAHTTQAGWEPPNVPAVWELV